MSFLPSAHTSQWTAGGAGGGRFSWPHGRSTTLDLWHESWKVSSPGGWLWLWIFSMSPDNPVVYWSSATSINSEFERSWLLEDSKSKVRRSCSASSSCYILGHIIPYTCACVELAYTHKDDAKWKISQDKVLPKASAQSLNIFCFTVPLHLPKV